MTFNTPILLIAFNRPQTTARVFAALKDLQPKQLFIALDAPRDEADEEACAAVKNIVRTVDWDCQVEYLIQEQNLGVKLAGPTAINWFFSKVEQGIILEDDCLPELSFFGYCEELLNYYQDNEQIWHISGDNFQTGSVTSDSYYFSRIPHIWGWATWRRAWQHYDIAMKTFPDFVANQSIKKIFPQKIHQLFWLDVFRQNYLALDKGWDFQWSYALIKHQALAINPGVNLISNIGFGAGAAHATDQASSFANLPTSPISLPLRHPSNLVVNALADDFIMSHNFGATWSNFFIKQILRRLGLFALAKRFYYYFKSL